MTTLAFRFGRRIAPLFHSYAGRVAVAVAAKLCVLLLIGCLLVAPVAAAAVWYGAPEGIATFFATSLVLIAYGAEPERRLWRILIGWPRR